MSLSFGLAREFREFEMARFTEADQKDAFPVLRHNAPRVNNPVVHLVAQRIGQRVVNDLKRAALVMADQMLHVFQNESGGAMVLDGIGNGEKEVALFFVLETVFLAQAQLLGDARDAEGLAGEAAIENIMRGNIGHGHGVDVAVGFLPEVRFVGDLSLRVPVGGKDALAARPFEGDAKAADAAKEINETQPGAIGARRENAIR